MCKQIHMEKYLSINSSCYVLSAAASCMHKKFYQCHSICKTRLFAIYWHAKYVLGHWVKQMFYVCSSEGNQIRSIEKQLTSAHQKGSNERSLIYQAIPQSSVIWIKLYACQFISSAKIPSIWSLNTMIDERPFKTKWFCS